MKRVLATVSAAAAVCVLGLASAFAADEPAKAKAPQHWIHWMGNFATQQGLDDAMTIMKRGAVSGYTGFVACDSKFEKYQLQDKSWVENVKKFRQACKDNKIDFIAPCAPFGYSAEFLTADPNLAEGFPVKDAPYVVKGGKLVPNDDVLLKNGSFEEGSAPEPKAWALSTPGKVAFIDSEVKHDGKVSVRIENPGSEKNAAGRVGQRIKVRPYQYYHLSAWIKTEKFDGKDIRMGALGGENTQWCTWAPPPITPDMDWTLVDAVFNTLENTEVTVYIGTWNGKGGKMWIDDVKVAPAGFVNIIRRDSAPLKITSDDGKTIFVEGKDFSKVADPKMLNDPKPGYFTTWHEVPPVTAIEGGALKEGTKVKVSYEHFLTGSKPEQVTACMSEPKTYKVFEDQVKFMTDNFQPDAFFMMYDEIRQGGWDNACASRNMTLGQIAGDSAAKCAAIIAKVSPGKPAFVWNDIFDPNHNAKKTEKDGKPFIMYMNKGNGPWYGSWEKLPKGVGIINWNNGSNESAAFFAGEGHQQIFSFNDPEKIVKWLEASGQKPGVVGVMYTDWNHNYKNLEKYIEAVKAWEKQAGYKN